MIKADCATLKYEIINYYIDPDFEVNYDGFPRYY